MSMTPVDQTVVLNQNRDKLRSLLRSRLVECGWFSRVSLLCREVAKDQHAKLSVDDIVEQVTPEARSLIPAAIKLELVTTIKALLTDYQHLDDDNDEADESEDDKTA